MNTILETEEVTEISPNTPIRETTETTRLGEIPLSALTSGDSGIISRLDGGDDFRCKMLSLGILPGKEVTVAGGEKHQPYILRIGDCRVMMDWGALGKIYVQPGSNCKGRRGWKW